MTFLFGVCVGCTASLVYMICGGDTFIFVPTWALIVFYPGFIAGNLAYKYVGFEGAYVVGILAVGISYGLIALVIRQLINRG
jgi:hypothetical protein